jgi:glycosyltransferase involved in cell wall biosynthesis
MSGGKASVIMVTSSYRIRGGHETVINNLCNGLKKLGHNMAIGAFSFEQNPPYDIKKVDLRRFRSLNNGVEADIIHSHQTQMNYYSLLTSKPFVFHYHGSSTEIQKINLKVSFLLVRSKISRLIAISNSALNDFIDTAGKISADIIYNGVDTDFYNTVLPRPYIKGDPQLLFVGNLYPHKNIKRIINSMPNILQLYPNAHLQVVGCGDDYQTLKYKVKEKKLDDRIELIGSTSDNDLRLRYSSCDVYISASMWEMFALPPLEAMACGKPMLLSNIPVHRELVEASNAGKIFSLEDGRNNISDSIKEVYDNRQSLGSAARKFALKCDWSIACKKVSRIYEEIMMCVN